MFTSLIRKLAQRPPVNRRRHLRNQRHAVAEVLETRQMLTHFVVTSLNDNEVINGQVTLREAIVAANTNAPFRDAPAGGQQDTITFHESLRGGRIILNRPLSLAGNLTIEVTPAGEQTDGDPRIAIDGNNQHQIILIGNDSEVTLRQLDLVNGRAEQGAAVLNHGDLLLDNVRVTDNVATQAGGGIYSTDFFGIRDSFLADNTAGRNGGAVYSELGVTVERSEFTRNSSAGNGGAIAAFEGGARITDSNLSFNSAAGSGGGVFAQELNVVSSGIHDNSATNSGGGIVTIAGQSLISNSTIAYNSTNTNGGGVVAVGGELSIVVSTVAFNQAGANSVEGTFGGGIATAGTVSLGSSIVIGNYAGEQQQGRDDDLYQEADGSYIGSYTIIGDPQTSAGLADIASNTVGGANGNALPAGAVLEFDPVPDAPTFVLPLIEGSLAIDHGKRSQAIGLFHAALTNDQTGNNPRVLFGDPQNSPAELDAGSFEFRPFGPAIVEITPVESDVWLQWQMGTAEGAQSLVLENLSSGQTGANAVFRDDNVVDDTYTFQDLPNGRYRVSLRITDAQGQASPWSIRTFDVNARPSVDEVSYEANTGNLEINWTAPPDTVRSEFWIANSTLQTPATQFAVESVAGSNTDSSFTASIGWNSVWVRTVNSSGVRSPWSEVMHFDVRPKLIGPDSSGFNRRPEFTWHDVEGVDGWEIWIQTGQGVVNLDGIQDNRFIPENDLPVGRGFWWVRAHHANGVSRWSDGQSFSTDGRVDVLPKKGNALDSPVVEFHFERIQGALSYVLYVRRESTGEVIFNENVGDRNSRRLALPESGDYTAWARAVGPDGSLAPWSRPVVYKSNGRAFSDTSAELQTAANSLTNAPTLRWGGRNGAQRYDVVLWNHDRQLEFKTSISGSGVWIPPHDLQEGKWSWFVRGRDAEGLEGDWVRGNSFLMGGQTRMTAPFGEVQEPRPQLEWQAVVGSVGYQLVIQTLGGQQVYRNDEIAVGITAVRPDVDLAVGDYRAWIRIVKPDGTFGRWSLPIAFEVL